MSAAYTFERFIRTCGYNDSVIAKGMPSRDLIYDYKVLLGGEHVATFKRGLRGSSWELYDRIDRAIVKPGRTWIMHIGEDCRSKADFVSLLGQVIVPTAEECAAWQESERQREAREQSAHEESIRLNRIKEAGPELLKALQGVLRVADRATAEFDVARAAIAKATGAAS